MNGTLSSWRQSSFCGPNKNCVQVAFDGGDGDKAAAVRDSKNEQGGHLTVTGLAWRTFLGSLPA